MFVNLILFKIKEESREDQLQCTRGVLFEALRKAQSDPDFMAWAKKFKFHMKNVYGDDAKKALMNFIKFFEDQAPMLRKYYQ